MMMISLFYVVFFDGFYRVIFLDDLFEHFGELFFVVQKGCVTFLSLHEELHGRVSAISLF